MSDESRFGVGPLVMHSSGHLLLSLVNSSPEVIEHQNPCSTLLHGVQRRDEQLDFPLSPDRVDHLIELSVFLAHPNEEIIEQWRDDDLQDW